MYIIIRSFDSDHDLTFLDNIDPMKCSKVYFDEQFLTNEEVGQLLGGN